MLDRTLKVVRSQDFEFATGYSLTEEGVPVVRVMENNVEKIKPSEGEEGEFFMGFSYGIINSPSTVSRVYKASVPSAGVLTVEIPDTPISGQLLVYDETEDVALTAGAGSPSDGEYVLSGKTFTFNTAQKGDSIKFQYRYSPTVLETILEGNQFSPYSFTSQDIYGSCGVIQTGTLYTSLFDASINWEEVSTVNLGDGILTNGGTGEAIDFSIISYPNENNPFLGLRKL